MSVVKISVVIPSYNRADSLKRCLESLERQTCDKSLFEVIVVNDGSADETSAFLSAFKKITPVNFVVIDQPNKGVSCARNAGIQAAKGEFIAFTDDDCILSPDWLSNMFADFESSDMKTAGVGGPLNCIASGEPTFISRFIEHLDEFNNIPVKGSFFMRLVHVSSLRKDDQVLYLRTSNAMFRKICLVEAGGFDETFKKPGGEDPDLCYRLLALGYRFHLDIKLIVDHMSRDSFSSYFSSLRRYLEGEIKKGLKKDQYCNKVISRTYSFLPAQKAASIILCTTSYPVSVFKLFKRKRYAIAECFLFPLILIGSKWYAFYWSLFYWLKYRLN